MMLRRVCASSLRGALASTRLPRFFSKGVPLAPGTENDGSPVTPEKTAWQTKKGMEDKDMCIVFTCKTCSTRSIKGISKQAYEHGVIVARCPGCQNLHLIADNLGYFADGKTNIETIMAEKGITVERATDLTPEGLVGPLEGRLGDEKEKTDL